MEKRKRILRKTKEAVYIRDKGICQICGNQISFAKMTIDHIYPLSKGGEKERWHGSIAIVDA